MTKKDKWVRLVLRKYYDETTVLNLYKEKFMENVTELTQGQYNRLSKSITIEDALEKLTDIQLKKYAREIEVPVYEDRAEQIKLIAFKASK
jgi:hypothetical protein